MKRWESPILLNLNLSSTQNSESSCGGTATEAYYNKDKGCSVTTCTYYVKNNNGNGKGGKCKGSDTTPTPGPGEGSGGTGDYISGTF